MKIKSGFGLDDWILCEEFQFDAINILFRALFPLFLCLPPAVDHHTKWTLFSGAFFFWLSWGLDNNGHLFGHVHFRAKIDGGDEKNGQRMKK